MEQGSSGQPFYLADSDSCTVDQIKTSDLRSLGDNVKLLAVIQNLSHDLVTKSENTYKKLDEIQRETEIKSVGVKNLINEFQMLADSQFIENRVYDADESDSPPEEFNKNIIDEENNKTPADQKILPIIHECISHSLKFIDENFNFNDKPLKQSSAESDDEEDYVKETLARALESNPFNRTPLPAIIGSKAFFSQNIFDDGENRVENNQNDNNSTISSDRKSSLQSDCDEEEDDETLFSPSKGLSIQHGIIPPPPPLPNFSYFANSKKDIKDDEDDEDEELFKQTEAEPKSLQGKLPETKSNQSWNPDSDHDSDDSDDLFKPPPQMNTRKSLESTKIPPEPTSKSPELFKPLITAQDLIRKIPQLKKNQSHDSEDDEDEELFKPVANDIKNVHENLPEIKSNASWNHDSDHDSDDSDDMFKPPPQVNPRKSLESTKPKIPEKPTIKSQLPRKLPEIKSSNTLNFDDSDDSDDLFKPPPQVNPRNSFKSAQISTESTTKSPEVFKPLITTHDLLRKIPQLKKNQSHGSEDDELFKKAETDPKCVQEKIPEIKSTQSWNDDSDDSDDMFKPPPPQVIPRKSLESSKLTVATKPTIKPEELQRKLPDIKSNSWKPESYFDDSDDSDDLFKLPPKVNPRKSLKSTKISTESTSKSPEVFKPSTTPLDLPRKLPELKMDPNHDSEDEELFEPTKNVDKNLHEIKSNHDDDDEEIFETTEKDLKNVHKSLPEIKSNDSWTPDNDHDSDDSDDLFKLPPQVNPRKSLESKKLPPESTSKSLESTKISPVPTSKSPEVFKPLITPPDSLRKIPQLKTNQNYYSEDEEDEDEEIFKTTEKDVKNVTKNLPGIKSNDSWDPDNDHDSDDSDDLFKLPPQVNPRKSLKSTKATVPTTPTLKSEEQPKRLPEFNSTNTLNFVSDSDDSDDLFKPPPRIDPRKGSDIINPKEVPGKLPENKFNQSWNLDSDDDDDLFRIKK